MLAFLAISKLRVIDNITLISFTYQLHFHILGLQYSIMRFQHFAMAATFCSSALGKTADPATNLAIRDVVNAFSFAVDTRPVPEFNSIFTQDAVLNLTIPGSQQTGIDNINKYLITLLTQFETQHSFGTQNVDVNADGTGATAITSFIGSFWDVSHSPPLYAQFCQQFNDTLVKTKGQWHISHKVVKFLVNLVEHIYCYC